MKSFFFTYFLNIKKGYLDLVNSKELSTLRKYISILHKTDFIKSDENYYNVKKKKILRQFLGQKFLYQKFIWIFFYFKKKNHKIIFPLPIEWSKKLIEQNIKVNVILSYFLYLIFSIYQFIKGFFFIFYILIKYFFFLTNLYSKKYHLNNSIMFYNISSKKINLANKVKYNLYSWFREKVDNNSNLIFFHKQNNSKFYNKNLMEENDEFKLFFPQFRISIFLTNLFKLILEFRKVSLLFYNLILFEENIKAIFYKSIKNIGVKKIFIVWTNNIFKPLWVYKLEDKGVEFFIFFNGFLNEIRLTKDLNFNFDHEGLSNLTWKNYYTWDKINSNFLKQKIDIEINTIEKGPIYFSDNQVKLDLPKKTIAVFGYENHKQNIGINTISDYEFCNKNFLKIFYNDIIEVSKMKDYKIVLKRKNELKHLEIKKNKKYFEKLFNNDKIIFVDPNISAFRVIEKCDMVISMPFTSTGKIAEELNKPSIYYDPFSWIQNNDPSGSNIKLIKGKENLKQWLN